MHGLRVSAIHLESVSPGRGSPALSAEGSPQPGAGAMTGLDVIECARCGKRPVSWYGLPHVSVVFSLCNDGGSVSATFPMHAECWNGLDGEMPHTVPFRFEEAIAAADLAELGCTGIGPDWRDE